MGLPVNALKDDELLHYASLDPEAATELVRRITEGGLDPAAERAELLETIHELETDAEYASNSEDELRDLQDSVDEAIALIKRAMKPDEQEISVNELLKSALEYLE